MTSENGTIRLSQDFFEEPVTRIIEREQFGKEALYLWIKLVALAVEKDDGGRLKRPDGEPHDVCSIASVTGFSEEETKAALYLLEKYGYIKVIRDRSGRADIYVSGWDVFRCTDDADAEYLGIVRPHAVEWGER